MASGNAPLFNPMFPGRGGVSGSNQNTPYGMPSMSTPGSNAMPATGTAMWPGANNYSSGDGNPYQVPGTGAQYFPWGTSGGLDFKGTPKAGRTTNPGSENLGHGIIATGLQYGGLSQDFADYIMTQIGAGMQPFNLQTMLPTGGSTQSGQLTAGLNPLMQQLQNFYMGQNTSLPGGNTMQTIANQGISALPEWQAMVNAQQQNIAQNQANLKEQYGFMGDLAGSPAATGLSNYAQQTTADQNALLGQLQQQNILQGQIPLMQQLMSGGQQFGGQLQQLDQNAIQNMYQEFQRVSPQNNPMLQYIMGLSTMYPPTSKTPTSGQTAMDWVNTGANVWSSVFG